MLLFYIRHGEPLYNPDSLTPMGLRQAESVGRRLAQYGVDKVFASASTRAIQTATPTAEMLKKEVVPLEWAHESLVWADLTVEKENGGRGWAFYDPEMRMKFNSDAVRALGDRWYTHPDFADTRFGEGIERVGREADAFLASLGYEHDRQTHSYRAVSPNDDRVAFFAHHGFGLAFLSWVLDIPYPQFATHFDIGFTGMTVIEFAGKENVMPTVLELSCDGHLFRDGLPTDYIHRVRF